MLAASACFQLSPPTYGNTHIDIVRLHLCWFQSSFLSSIIQQQQKRVVRSFYNDLVSCLLFTDTTFVGRNVLPTVFFPTWNKKKEHFFLHSYFFFVRKQNFIGWENKDGVCTGTDAAAITHRCRRVLRNGHFTMLFFFSSLLLSSCCSSSSFFLFSPFPFFYL